MVHGEFDKNKLNPEIFNMFANNEYDGVKHFLIEQNCFHGYSFISLNLQHRNRRKSA